MPPKAFRPPLEYYKILISHVSQNTIFSERNKKHCFIVQRTTLHDEGIEDYKENNYTWNLYDIMVEAGVSLTRGVSTADTGSTASSMTGGCRRWGSTRR